MAKKHKEVLKLIVTLEPGEDGYIIAECPAIPGCMSQGRTHEEAVENIRDAILACLEVRKRRGMPLTVETREVEVAV
ncbi:type II toxin-antitoxin system HicB family antitoxin [Candidatus Acetothermia bacterium]|jgi:predicted RNase H-like HicB family nuclease|nr:type II toxin-antitoxin system HicB family antitoxin [Candidatus Acetothermia bacterium]MCI2432714.1 type II toxin-antitoxin system HicB family antitoxin [Candidatus Acetothermia bacterium]MCI2436865.1 type II toxin-antitoxin system HicB family antitoxin [Candidatus Acetothermia bacterium]